MACAASLLEGLDQKELILEDYVSGILGDLLDAILRHQGPLRTTGTSRA